MAGPARGSTHHLKERLLREGPSHSFAQALRLLRRVVTAEGAGPDRSAFWRRVKVRPHLSMAFAPADIHDIRQTVDEPPRYEVTVAFLGLYGASSPLPNFYTEDLLDEQNAGKSASRDFVDLVNSAVYPLYFDSWSKHRLFHALVEDPDPAALERLFCLLGLPGLGRSCRHVDPRALLKYIGLFSLASRPAEGLRALLADHFGLPVALEPCIERRVPIPPDQRCRLGLGQRLGEDTCLGTEIADAMGAFRVTVGPLDADGYHRFRPGSPGCLELAELVRLYCRDQPRWELRLVLAPGQARGLRLGDPPWSALGLGSWLLPDRPAGAVAVDFPEPDPGPPPTTATGETAWSA
jgi:type VI secretion system protein ImpH